MKFDVDFEGPYFVAVVAADLAAAAAAAAPVLEPPSSCMDYCTFAACC